MRLGKKRISSSNRLPSLGESGSALFAVVLTAGLLAAIVYSVIELHKKGSATEKNLLGQSDALMVTGNMAVLLSDGPACFKTFGGLDPSANGVTVSQVKDYTGKAQFSVGTIYGNRSIQLSGVTLGGTGQDAQSRLNRWSSTGPGTGLALVRVSWLQTGSAGGQSLGPSLLYRTFLLDTKIDASSKKITACSAITSAITQTQFGTGTPNHIPLWVNSTTLGDSVMAESAKKIGVGTTSAASTFSVAGGMAVGGYAGASAAPLNGLIVSGKVGVGTDTPSAPLELRGELRLSGASGHVGLRAPATAPGPVTWTLPAGNGLPGQLLMTNGKGTLSWGYCGPPPGGCAAQVIDDCHLANTAAGGSSGACIPGDAGACSYDCAANPPGAGKWVVSSNSCVKACTEPGSQAFSVPGTYSFVVPKYCTKLNVVVRGGGGGGGQGGGASYWENCQSSAGGSTPSRPGGLSSFNGAMMAQGGGAGSCSGAGGAGGTASGGTMNLAGGNGQPGSVRPDGHQAAPGRGGAGGGPGGGAGGDPGICTQGSGSAGAPGGSGGTPGGGGGGSGCWNGGGGGGGGGYTAQTFGKGALAPGSTITVVVGGGGAGENRNANYDSTTSGPGGGGAAGSVTIDWN